MPRRQCEFASILCPVDFSRASQRALEHAAALAERSGARLTVMFVNDPLLVAASIATTSDKDALSRTCRDQLHRFVTRVLGPKAAAAARLLVMVGDPVEEIARAVRRLQADLVVVGTRGLSGAKRLLLGSVTAGLLKRMPAPVLATPAVTARALAHAGRSGYAVGVIDLDARAQGDARTITLAARAFGLDPLLLHVVRRPRMPRWLTAHVLGGMRTRVAEAGARLDRVVARVESPDLIERRVVTGEAADQTIACASDVRAGLIILMLPPLGRLFGSREGEVAYRILCDARVPVLALPKQRRQKTEGRVGGAPRRREHRHASREDIDIDRFVSMRA